MQKRSVFRLFGIAIIAGIAAASAPAVVSQSPRAAVEVTVFKSPTCGCCKEWVEHLRKHAKGTAFTVIARDTADTAFVNGYVVEGHVPAQDIQRMLRDKPKIAGIAAPGMPVGSPGMEVGSRKDPYDVLAFKRDGSTSIYAKH
jgi:hypothetical protein